MCSSDLMLLYDWSGDYPDAENYLTPLLGCQRSVGHRCLEGNSVLSGSGWTAPGLEEQLLRSSRKDGPERLALLGSIQRRAAAGVPYLPLWRMAPVAWARPQVRELAFDGSGRLVLSALRRQAAGTTAKARAMAAAGAAAGTTAAPPGATAARTTTEPAATGPKARGEMATTTAPAAEAGR